MPHASLLGSNGYHSTFTSEMISGQINVLVVLKKYRNTHDFYTCMCTWMCMHSSHIRMQYKHTCLLTQPCLSAMPMCRQLKDQHHLQVWGRHCPCFHAIFKPLLSSILWEMFPNCFLKANFLKKKAICSHMWAAHGLREGLNIFGAIATFLKSNPAKVEKGE